MRPLAPVRRDWTSQGAGPLSRMGTNSQEAKEESQEFASLGIATINADKYEISYEHQVEHALQKQHLELEWRRLAKIREAISKLEARIDSLSTKPALSRMSKLMDRLEELKEEEGLILQRISQLYTTAEKERNPRSLAIEEGQSIFKKDHSHRDTPTTYLGQKQALFREENLSTESTITKGDFSQTKKRSTFKTHLSSPDDVDSSSEGVESSSEDHEGFRDDGDGEFFKLRLSRWIETQPTEIRNHYCPSDLELSLEEQAELLALPHLERMAIEGFMIPKQIWSRLFDYQKAGINWMADLHRQGVGGILGDEMGLGKSIQAISFIAALQASRHLDHPVLIISPATVMKQWVKEFHNWWPFLRIILLHSSGALGEDLTGALRMAVSFGHVVITSYGHLRQHNQSRRILAQQWSCVILDEGHKIRNPLAEITVICKQLRANHRLILSGTPIQNNLLELWSLVDFVFPGRLGAMNVFKNEFAIPINAGGYVNASSLQVQTSYRCACILKDLVAPYLLRRIKADVAQDLPPKQEQVLFCPLTEHQRHLYEHYIASEDVRAILAGTKNILAGIDVLRKICNHPQLLRYLESEDAAFFGVPPGEASNQSGKMHVLDSILHSWAEGDHRVLLFCQTRQMLDIIEAFVSSKGYRYMRMDGTTPIYSRMAMVDEFNVKQDIYLFLLTTKVGGLGINLTGADRVIIYDPDWNPSTDMQARERAWRLGQRRPVIIYRMLTVGTIEEKIYHRQIFKQYLTNRILADPKQARFFKSSDLYDLFSLSIPEDKGASETRALLDGLEGREDDWKMIGQGGHAKEGEEHKATGWDKSLKSDHGHDRSHILEELCQITGLHSALEHDRLVERPKQEAMLVEREARLLANEAVEALKRSREQIRQQNSLGVKGGISSASILVSIRKRQALLEDNPSLIGNSSEPLQGLVDQLIDLFRDNGGACSSELIARHFSSKINGPEAIVFRQILRILATLNLSQRRWTLKAEHRLMQ